MSSIKNSELIFLDTEFSSLDPYKGEILSISLVKASGEELYLELEYKGEVTEWVKENILPTLTAPKVSKKETRKRIKKFVGTSRPYPVAFINQFDIVYLHKIIPADEKLFGFPPIDFATMLWVKGYDPLEYLENQKEFVAKFGIDASKYRQHNALDDARLLREVFMKVNKMKIDATGEEGGNGS